MTASKSVPNRITRMVSAPYHNPDAIAIGMRVRAGESRATPANGGTRARHTGSRRLMKIP